MKCKNPQCKNETKPKRTYCCKQCANLVNADARRGSSYQRVRRDTCGVRAKRSSQIGGIEFI